MKKGINAWCFPNEMPIKDVFALAADEGFDGIELNLACEGETGYLSIGSREKDCEKLKTLSEKNKLPISSISTAYLWDFPLSDNNLEKVEKGKTAVKTMLDAAKALGADTVLVVPGCVTKDVSYKTCYDRALKAINELKLCAEEKQVSLGIENVWNKFLLSPLEMRAFIDAIDSPFVRFYLDAGNVLQFGFPQHWVEALSGMITKVHIKDFDCKIGNMDGFVNLLQGDLDWGALMKALRETGYDSYITAELSPYKTNPTGLIRDTSAAMDYILSL